jgi:hypothetical protein
LALLIAGRYSSDPILCQNDIVPENVAQSIVNEFKENLEQGETAGNMLTNDLKVLNNN